KLHCWVCAAPVTTSCIGRALPRGRTAVASRRAHCYKTGPDKSSKGRVTSVTGSVRLAQNAGRRLIIWRVGRPEAFDRPRRPCTDHSRGRGGAHERRPVFAALRN